MEGINVGEEDMGDGMACSDHPYRNNPGGICAFCLQKKLGKLVSSSLPLPNHSSLSFSSSSSSSFGHENITGNGVGPSSSSLSSNSLGLSLSTRPASAKRRNGPRIPFLLTKKSRNKMVISKASSVVDRGPSDNIVFKRSKSTATPRRGHSLDTAEDDEAFSPRKRHGFWSFLHLSLKPNTSRKREKISRDVRGEKALAIGSGLNGKSSIESSVSEKNSIGSSSLVKRCDVLEEKEENETSQMGSVSSFELKVSRSVSVGYGSRSFSGDFFERISTGFGDCTLRRVESQREGKPKAIHRQNHMKERFKCGGIFGGFILTSSLSSSSSSSYWISSSAEDVNGKSSSVAAVPVVHGRRRSWGWALASPMRAFSKNSSKEGRREGGAHKKTAPNLDAVPSVLAVR